jgi:hypothetical protein
MTDRMKLFGSSTALTRKQASAPVAYYEEHGLLKGRVLDYGCGLDVHRYTRFDPVYHNHPEVLLTSYDTVMCNYVLNVQPTDHLIIEILTLLWHLTAPGGRVLVAVLFEGKEGTHSVGGGKPRNKAEWTAVLRQVWPRMRSMPGGIYTAIKKT